MKAMKAEAPAPAPAPAAAPEPAAKAGSEKIDLSEDTAASQGPAFDAAAAKAALGAAAAQAGSCGTADGPTGTGKVQVTFSPSGSVATVSVTDGVFGGTPVGSCVARLFRAAKVPAFSGAAVTVSKSFSVE
jgi:hypothetical protein